MLISDKLLIYGVIERNCLFIARVTNQSENDLYFSVYLLKKIIFIT